MNARRAERRNIAAQVRLRRSGSLNYVVHAYDLSQTGCRLEFVQRPRISEWVWVKFEGLAAIDSRVRWTDGNMLGIEFTNPIDPRVLDVLVARLESDGSIGANK